jgi:hypothetical protein
MDSFKRGLSGSYGEQLLRNWLLIHTRLIHGGICLSPQARTWLYGRNINNVLLNGIIDFDLLIIRLTGDGTWSEDHLILGKKLNECTLPLRHH